jgi:hypothetical protein
MPRFKAHIRDGRRKLADLEVDVRPGCLPQRSRHDPAAAAQPHRPAAPTRRVRSLRSAEHARAQVSQAGLKLEEAKTKKLLGCVKAAVGSRDALDAR